MSYDIVSVEQTSPPRFLADRMVGKLARWLRLLGYDTVYLPQLSPQGVMNEARRQGRIILTRDSRIVRRKDAPLFVFIEDDRFREQLCQVVRDLRLDPVAHLLTRCSECNAQLQPIVKDKLKDRVPEYVWRTQAEFRRCPDCHRIYWGATHKERMMDELRRLDLLKDK